jgi:hypothetical protein
VADIKEDQTNAVTTVEKTDENGDKTYSERYYGF